MKPPRALRLNSIDQFRKRSPRLHLEEYSHCEVPAGCGGVVLRWVDDSSPRAVNLKIDIGGESKASARINGEEPDSPWLIPVGANVLALEVHSPLPGQGLVLAAAKDRGGRLVFISRGDGTWRGTLEEPDSAAWKQPGFDDSAWSPLEERVMPPPGEQDQWRREQLLAAGAAGLCLPELRAPRDRIWIRRAFNFGDGHGAEACAAAPRATLACLGTGKCAAHFGELEPGNLQGFEDEYMVFGRPGNKGITSSEKLMPSLPQYLEAVSRAEQYSARVGLELTSVHPWGPGARLESRSVVNDTFGCGAGNTVCSVSCTGDVSPCSFLGPAHVAGNLRRDSLEAIWSDSAIFDAMRDLEGNPACLGCRHLDLCGGGCRVRALAAHGSLNAPDGHCMEEQSRCST